MIKRFLIILTILLLGWSPSFAASVVVVAGSGTGAAAPSCTTSNHTKLYDTLGGSSAGNYYFRSAVITAGEVSLSATTTITRYVIWITEIDYSSTTATLQMYNVTGSPYTVGSAISGTDVTLADPQGVAVEFDLATPKTGIASGSYFLVATQSMPDNNNYYWQATASTGKRFLGASTYYTGYTARMEVWGCQ